MSDDVEVADRDEQIFCARLAGKSVRLIAKRFGLTVEEASKIIEERCAPLSASMRRQELQLDLERLDALQTVFHEAAMRGDVASAAVYIKILERRALVLGFDQPASTRVSPIEVTVAPQETSTDRIRRALEDLARERLPAPSNGHGEEP